MATGIQLSTHRQRKSMSYAFQSFSKSTSQSILRRLGILRPCGLYSLKKKLFRLESTSQPTLAIRLLHESRRFMPSLSRTSRDLHLTSLKPGKQFSLLFVTNSQSSRHSRQSNRYGHLSSSQGLSMGLYGAGCHMKLYER